MTTIFGGNEPLKYRDQQFVGDAKLVDKFLLAHWNIWSMLRSQRLWFTVLPYDIIRLIARYYFPWRLTIYTKPVAVVGQYKDIPIPYTLTELRDCVDTLYILASIIDFDDYMQQYAGNLLYDGMMTYREQISQFRVLRRMFLSSNDPELQGPISGQNINVVKTRSLACSDGTCKRASRKTIIMDDTSTTLPKFGIKFVHEHRAHCKYMLICRYIIGRDLYINKLEMNCDEALISILLNYLVVARIVDSGIVFVRLIRCDAKGFTVVYIFRIDDLVYCSAHGASLQFICKHGVYVLDSEHLF